MMTHETFQRFSYTIPWNVALITVGAAIFAVGFKAIVVPHQFISGGVTGVGLIAYYLFGGLEPGMWYLALNVPIFVLGWIMVSRRFFFYSLYGMLIISFFIDLVPWTFPIRDNFLALLAGGTLMGTGSGIALRSLGSCGGTDILAVILFQRYNLPVGQVMFVFNLLVFGAGLAFLDPESVLYSLAMVFVVSQVMEQILGLFNQRRMVLIISDKADEIEQRILRQLNRGVTEFTGRGGFTKRKRRVLLTVINNLQVKRLEEIVFTSDPEAFTIIGQTLNVLGRGFSRRKTY